MPNEQWDDFALSRQFEAIDRRLDTHEHSLEGLSHFPIDTAKAALEIEHMTVEMGRLRSDLSQVAESCNSIRAEIRQADQEKQKGRTALLIAAVAGTIGALGTIGAAIVAVLGA